MRRVFSEKMAELPKVDPLDSSAFFVFGFQMDCNDIENLSVFSVPFS